MSSLFLLFFREQTHGHKKTQERRLCIFLCKKNPFVFLCIFLCFFTLLMAGTAAASGLARSMRSLGSVRRVKEAHIRGPVDDGLPFALVAIRRIDQRGDLAPEIVALELFQLVGRQPYVHRVGGLEGAQAIQHCVPAMTLAGAIAAWPAQKKARRSE
ncbi:hypothetical protein TW95_gp0094 [Pandoravirus inopinatum]|uniref:Uncharacterized protein n=1 Tax=Pandoravirus inopinatum TaxID=1605721 RepID=A0A0B5IVY5_9VIRU|nr:hypothetical protein TW95_gp0094 [Pandoravirus inopinatum]AJF96828.1 hypothetical protein [Pandoravirus inopinatum]